MWRVGCIVSGFLFASFFAPAGAAQEMDIVFVVDESGSMCRSGPLPQPPGKVAVEVDGFKAGIDNVIVPFIADGGGPVRIGVVRFSSSASIAIGLTDVGSTSGVDAVKAALDAIKANPECGNTNLGEALQLSDTVLGGGSQRKLVNLASNGAPTVGPGPTEVLSICSDLKNAGREIWTIAILPGAATDLMASCSGPGDGQAFVASTIDEFATVEGEKLGTIVGGGGQLVFIPTLTEWGIIVLWLLLALSGSWILLHRFRPSTPESPR